MSNHPTLWIGMPQRPINPYGRTKLISEEMLRDHGAAHGLRHVSLRYFNATRGRSCGPHRRTLRPPRPTSSRWRCSPRSVTRSGVLMPACAQAAASSEILPAPNLMVVG